MRRISHKKRWLSMLLSLVMTISCLANGSIAYAASGQESEDTTPDAVQLGDTLGGGTLGGDTAEVSTVTLTLVYDPLWQWIGVGEPDVTMTLTSGTLVDLSTLEIPGHEGDGSVVWLTEMGDLDTAITQPFVLTGDTTIYAGGTTGGEDSLGGDTLGDNILGGDDTAEASNVTLTLVFDILWQWIGVGEPDVTITLASGTLVDLSTLEIPGHTGERYQWYRDINDLSTEITAPFVLTADQTLYAGATISGGDDNGTETDPGTEAEFYLSYQSNGGSYFRARGFTQPTDVDFDDPDYFPTREGYVFTGWYTDSTLEEQVTGIVRLTGNLTVWAGWKPEAGEDAEKTVTLTLVYHLLWQELGTGEPDVTIQLPWGCLVDLAVLEIPGHEEDDPIVWTEVAGDMTTVITTFSMMADKTIYAEFAGDRLPEENGMFYLRYQSNGGSELPERAFLEPTDVDFDDPDFIPVREGYTFTGWYADEALEQQLTGVVQVIADLTVWAGWALEETPTPDTVILTLVYDPLWQWNGGDNPDVTIALPYGTVVDLTTLEIPGHEDDGTVWWTEESGDESTRITEPFVITADKTIYAETTTGGSIGEGETHPFYLRYQSNGGSHMEARKFTEPTRVYFDDPLYIPQREGYTFTGWYADEGLTELLTGFVTVSDNLTVWAGWEPAPAATDDPTKEPEEDMATLTVVYDLDWKTTGEGIPDVAISLPVGTLVDLSTLEIPGHLGETAYGWYRIPGNPESRISDPFVLTADTTIYAGSLISGANNTPEEFYLSYQSNGGSHVKARKFTEPTQVDFDDPDYFPTREGYTFTGWYADKELEERLTGVVLISNGMAVWAGWEAIQEPSQEPGQEPSQEPGQEPSQEPTAPAEESPAPSFAPDIEEEEKVVLTLVYDPRWQWYGVGVPDVLMELPVGTEIDMLTLVIPGHEDEATNLWYEDLEDLDTLVYESFIMTADKTLYAGTALGSGLGIVSDRPSTSTTFYLTYCTNGGSDIESRAFTEITEVDFDDPNYIPTREGYVFTGWYIDSTLKGRLSGTIKIASDLTVWAGWEEEKPVTQLPAETPAAIPGDTATTVTTETATVDASNPAAEVPTEEKKQTTPSGSASKGNPATGDQAALTPWLLSLLLSCLGLVMVLADKKNRSGKRNRNR